MDGIHILYTFFFSGCVAFLSFQLRLLTTSGSIGQFFLAVIICGLGEWQFNLPILSFFLFSSLVSNPSTISKSSAKQYFDHGSARDAWQVVANDGVPAAVVISLVVFRLADISYRISLRRFSCRSRYVGDRNWNAFK